MGKIRDHTIENKGKDKLISVIVPVYNGEKYLRECLDSVLEQTYKKIEVVMVDDGSVDSSGIICDEYADRYDNFMVIHKRNAGLGMARNTGMGYITGDHVFFLDSDDRIKPTFIEILYKNLREKRVDMCKGGSYRFTDQGDIVSIRKYENEIFDGNKAKKELMPRMIGSLPSHHDSIEMSVWGAIYNAKIIKKYGLKFPSERELISEDLMFNMDYLQYADGACTISEVGYGYRMNTGSLTTRYRPDRFEACRHLYLKVKERISRSEYGQETILRIHKMFFIYLKMCMSQEDKKISGKSIKEGIKSIKKICDDAVVRQSIHEYPVKELEIKQRVFLMMIEFRMSAVLYFMVTLGKMR